LPFAVKGGRKGPTVLLHQICHNEIHSAITERQLAKRYYTPELLLTHPMIAKFVEFIAGRPPSFYRRRKGAPPRTERKSYRKRRR
jgi:hypothetical protein